MNTYMVMFSSGSSKEIEADVYQADGEDWVFLKGPSEILRVKVAEVLSISKAR